MDPSVWTSNRETQREGAVGSRGSGNGPPRAGVVSPQPLQRRSHREERGTSSLPSVPPSPSYLEEGSERERRGCSLWSAAPILETLHHEELIRLHSQALSRSQRGALLCSSHAVGAGAKPPPSRGASPVGGAQREPHNPGFVGQEERGHFFEEATSILSAQN